MNKEELRRYQKDCRDENIKPILDTLKKMDDKMDVIMPTVKEINDLRRAWTITGSVGSCIVKAVIGIGVILGAIYAIKDWIRK